MTDPAPADRRVLLIRRRYLGDIVLLGPVFRNLRRQWPEARLAALVEPAYADVLALNPDVDEVLVLPRSFREWLTFLGQVRRLRFTHVLDFDNTERTAAITLWSGAGCRIAYNRELVPFRSRWFYTMATRVRNAFYEANHITETYLQMLAAIDVPVTTRDFQLEPRADDIAEMADWLTGRLGKPRGRLLVHPGSRSNFRLWPAERFSAVIDHVQAGEDTTAVIIAGPGEQRIAAEIAGRCARHPLVFDRPLSIPKLGALISLFDRMLCHDSGPMHLAVAVGTPVVALYGSQNATIWGPLGKANRVLQTPLPCTCLASTPTPCVKHDSYRSYCVRKIGTDQVIAALSD